MFKYFLQFALAFQRDSMCEHQTIMNISQQNFIQIFFSTKNYIFTRIDNQIPNDNEYFTPKFYSHMSNNSNIIFAHDDMIYYQIEN